MKTYKFAFSNGLQIGYPAGVLETCVFDPARNAYIFHKNGEEMMIIQREHLMLMTMEAGPATPGIGESNIDVKHIEGEVAKAGMTSEARESIIGAGDKEVARYQYRKDGDAPTIFDTCAAAPDVWRIGVTGNDNVIEGLVALANAEHDRRKLAADAEKKIKDADLVLMVTVKDEQSVMTLNREIFESMMKGGTFRAVLTPICENASTGEQFNFVFSEDGSQVFLRRCIVTSTSNRKSELFQTATK